MNQKYISVSVEKVLEAAPPEMKTFCLNTPINEDVNNTVLRACEIYESTNNFELLGIVMAQPAFVIFKNLAYEKH